MQTDVLIIGQGISGTFLSYYLQKAGVNHVVIDDNKEDTPSKIAAGIINPVTGRRLVTVWMADEILPFAWNAYQEIGSFLQVNAISQKNILDFFPNPFMRESFIKKKAEQDPYIDITEEDFSATFNYEFGVGVIKPVYTAHLQTLIPAWRNYLQEQNMLLSETFDAAALHTTENGISYKDITATKIIFCDGADGSTNTFFKNLPFAPNKGEALVLSIPGLSQDYVYKKGMLLAPLQEPNTFWIGSNYLWDFSDDKPSEQFYNNTLQQLQHFLKIPFTVEKHLAGVRPATVERRPFVGFQPRQPNIGILNGMGTKGCSLAPYFAQQLTNNITKAKAISPEADVNRYAKVLSR